MSTEHTKTVNILQLDNGQHSVAFTDFKPSRGFLQHLSLLVKLLIYLQCGHVRRSPSAEKATLRFVDKGTEEHSRIGRGVDCAPVIDIRNVCLLRDFRP